MEQSTSNNLPANILSMATALVQSASQAGAASGTDAFMKFTKFGEWVFGVEGTEVQEGSVWAVNPRGFRHGWTAWGTKEHGTDGQNVGESMVPATHPMPQEGSLPAVKGEWAKAIGIQLRCTNGEDEGIQVMFKSNSHGGRKAYASLLQTVAARIQAGHADCMPLVKLTGDSYQHKTYGKIYNPVIEVVGWANHADETPVSASVTDQRPPAHSDSPKAQEAQQPQEEVKEEAPRRRRRRVVE